MSYRSKHTFVNLVIVDAWCLANNTYFPSLHDDNNYLDLFIEILWSL